VVSSVKISSATLSILLERGLPVVTEYELYRIIYSLRSSGQYKGEKFRGRRGPTDRKNYRRVVGELLSLRYIRPDPDFSGIDIIHDPLFENAVNFTRVFRISDIPDGSAEDIACIVDPFCYLSHLSAMQRYSLTNRIPQDLSISSPLRWTDVRNVKLSKDYPDLLEIPYVAPLLRIQLPDVIRRRSVVLHKTVRNPNLRQVRGSAVRIASIGETFAQMLDRPELCGGMPHVYDVWMEHANVYVDEIIQAIDASSESIIKVRAGYFLNEALGIQDPRVEDWQRFAQRGGSRKLDPSAPYAPTFSEKWKISLNVQRANSSL